MGYGSRRDVQALIRSGRVTLDGRPVRDSGAETDGRQVAVDGKAVPLPGHTHIMLYKPAGLLTAARDREAPTVMDLLPPLCVKNGCMPVGRLDKDTTGILFLTDDGTLAHRLISPKRHVDKVYRAELEVPLPPDAAERFRNGIALQDFTALPAELEVLSLLEARVTVYEGKYHQVKRMFAAVGCPVVRLYRESFGPLRLDPRLGEGEYRPLTEDEIRLVYRAAGMEEKQ